MVAKLWKKHGYLSPLTLVGKHPRVVTLKNSWLAEKINMTDWTNGISKTIKKELSEQIIVNLCTNVLKAQLKKKIYMQEDYENQ